MPDKFKQGQEWIEEAIRQSSSVEVEIQWAEDEDRGPPDVSGTSKIKSSYRVVVVTPEGSKLRFNSCSKEYPLMRLQREIPFHAIAAITPKIMIITKVDGPDTINPAKIGAA